VENLGEPLDRNGVPLFSFSPRRVSVLRGSRPRDGNRFFAAWPWVRARGASRHPPSTGAQFYFMLIPGSEGPLFKKNTLKSTFPFYFLIVITCVNIPVYRSATSIHMICFFPNIPPPSQKGTSKSCVLGTSVKIYEF
jgi:hypothetical protein